MSFMYNPKTPSLRKPLPAKLIRGALRELPVARRCVQFLVAVGENL